MTDRDDRDVNSLLRAMGNKSAWSLTPTPNAVDAAMNDHLRAARGRVQVDRSTTSMLVSDAVRRLRAGASPDDAVDDPDPDEVA